MDDDLTLLAASARGDAEAFARFYRRYLSLVVAFALRATGDREVAADLSGEVFAAALGASGRYRAEHETAGPWLMGIAANKLRESERQGRVQDQVRRQLRIRPIELSDEDLERVDELASEGSSAVLIALASLPAHERAAVEGRVLQGRDYSELARELRCSESVVRKRVSRGIARMRGRLSDTSRLETDRSEDRG